MTTSNLVRPTRRTLVRSAAWSVPVVSLAAAAPAFAASPCDPKTYLLDWGTTSYTRTDARNASATVTLAGSAPVTVTFKSVSFGANTPDATRNLSVPPNTGTSTTLDPVVNNLGGRTGERGLMLTHSASTAGRDNRQEITITFSRAVQGLTFFITDIDRITASPYADRVELTSVPAVARTQTLDGITGVGTAPTPASNPWQRAGDENVPENSPGAQVQVKYPAGSDVTSLTLTYWNAEGGPQYHRIYLGDLSFTAKGC